MENVDRVMGSVVPNPDSVVVVREPVSKWPLAKSLQGAKPDTKVWVCEMLRWGASESHHYVLGVYTSEALAKQAGEVEVSWRGGKYDYRILQVMLDAPIAQEKIDHHEACQGEALPQLVQAAMPKALPGAKAKPTSPKKVPKKVITPKAKKVVSGDLRIKRKGDKS